MDVAADGDDGREAADEHVAEKPSVAGADAQARPHCVS